MHTRQSGAAHVPIMFFLILMVMFLGALGFAYVTLTKNGELMQQKNNAEAVAKSLRSKTLLYEHYIEDIGQVIDKPGEYKGRSGSQGLYDGATLDGTKGLVNPAELKSILEKACSDARVATARGVENVLGSMVTKVQQTEQRNQEISAERDKVLTEKNEIDRKFAQTASETANQAREWNQALDQTRSDFASANATKDQTISQLTQTVRDKTANLSEAKEAAAAKEKELTKEKNNLAMHNSALVAKDRMRNPIDTADGKVLVARQGITTAFISLGRKDMLQPGTIFRVKNPNSDAVKGYATVTRIEDERAEVALSEIVDPIGDSVREGDLLFNELYTPRVTRTIYLMGRFSHPYNQEQLTTLLKRLGNKVVTSMRPGVDTVILGDDPVNEAGDGFAKVEESEEYKKAIALGVEFSSLRKVRDLIKL